MNTGIRLGSATVCVAAALLLSGCVQTHQDRARLHLRDAQEYLALGLDDSALAAFDLALQENPALLDAHLGMGSIYRARGDLPAANRAYERAVTLAPTSFDAHYYLGLTRQLLGRLHEAVKSYLRALAIDPESFDANEHAASAYLQLGRPGDALAYARKATELSAHDTGARANLGACYSLLGRYAEAAEAFSYTIDICGAKDAPVYLGLANAQMRLTQFKGAAQTLQTLIGLHPSSTAHERLGYVQFKLQKYDESLASYRAAVALDAKDTAALNGLGVSLMTLYIQMGRTDPTQRDAALDAWRKSVQLKPDQPRIVDLLNRYQRF